MKPTSVYPNPANPRSVTPAVIARRPRVYELLTGHQRLAVAQAAGVRFPAVMGTGETVWIEPDGTVATPDAQPHDSMRRTG